MVDQFRYVCRMEFYANVQKNQWDLHLLTMNVHKALSEQRNSQNNINNTYSSFSLTCEPTSNTAGPPTVGGTHCPVPKLSLATWLALTNGMLANVLRAEPSMSLTWPQELPWVPEKEHFSSSDCSKEDEEHVGWLSPARLQPAAELASWAQPRPADLWA